MSRIEHSTSVGVDRLPLEKLSGAGQEQATWRGRPAGTEHCLRLASTKSQTRAGLCPHEGALFQHEAGHGSKQAVLWLLQGAAYVTACIRAV